MPQRAWEWSKQIMFGQQVGAPLNFGKELWKWDVSLYESVGGIRAAAKAAGRSLNDDSILFEATSSLITDVVDAAGGVEQAYQRFCHAIDSIRAIYRKWADLHPDLLTEGAGMTHESVETAWYSLEEMLIWVRILDDRLKRKSFNKSECKAKQGLIPALANGPRRDLVISARDRLLSEGAREARYLSNLSLHMQSSRAGSKSVRSRSGEPVLPFPDPVSASIGHRWQLTYEPGRDAFTFASELMATVEQFMAEMISAFEMHLPDRFKAP